MNSSPPRTLAATDDAAIIVQRDTESGEIALFFETSDSAHADPEAATPLEVEFTFVPAGVAATIPESADVFEISVLPLRIEMTRYGDSSDLLCDICSPDWEDVERLADPLPFVFVETRPSSGTEE